MKATEKYFFVVLFIMLGKVVLTFTAVTLESLSTLYIRTRSSGRFLFSDLMLLK